MTAAAPVLVWTRALSDWARDSTYLADVKGLIRVPCLHVDVVERPIADATEPVVVVTSPRSVESLSREVGSRKDNWPTVVHTFGSESRLRLDALFGTATEKESARVRYDSASRTGAEFAGRLALELAPDAAVAVLGPAEPAFDIAGYLRSKGFAARHVTCYRTNSLVTDLQGAPLTGDAAASLSKNWRGVVCFASPSAVDGFVAAFLPRMTRLSSRLVAVVLGPTTATAARPHFDHVGVSPENELASLVTTAIESRNKHFPVGSELKS